MTKGHCFKEKIGCNGDDITCVCACDDCMEAIQCEDGHEDVDLQDLD